MSPQQLDPSMKLSDTSMELPVLQVIATISKRHFGVDGNSPEPFPDTTRIEVAGPPVSILKITMAIDAMRNTITSSQLNNLLFLQQSMSKEINQLIATGAKYVILLVVYLLNDIICLTIPQLE